MSFSESSFPMPMKATRPGPMELIRSSPTIVKANKLNKDGLHLLFVCIADKTRIVLSVYFSIMLHTSLIQYCSICYILKDLQIDLTCKQIMISRLRQMYTV